MLFRSVSPTIGDREALEACTNFAPNEAPFNTLAQLGVSARDSELLSWDEVLHQRAIFSDVKKRKATAGVPEMTFREYERWKEGVRLSFCRFPTSSVADSPSLASCSTSERRETSRCMYKLDLNFIEVREQRAGTPRPAWREVRQIGRAHV